MPYHGKLTDQSEIKICDVTLNDFCLRNHYQLFSLVSTQYLKIPHAMTKILVSLPVSLVLLFFWALVFFPLVQMVLVLSTAFVL